MTIPRYIQLTDLKDYMGLGATAAQDSLLMDCIVRAESAIDTYTRRSFVGSAGTSYYNRYAQGQVAGAALYLDKDLYALTAVYNGDGQTIPAGSVWLEPRNEGPPYRIIRLKSSYVWIWNTDADVTISGTWGYSLTAPDDVQQAAVRYAAHLFRQKDAGPQDVAGFPEGGEVPYPKGMPDDVRYLLSPYRSKSGGIV